MTWKFSRLLRPFLQVGFIWVALGTSVSRISDYKHHPSDVLTGALLGVTVAVLTVKHFIFRKYVIVNEFSSQGILNRLEKIGKITQNTRYVREFQTNVIH